MAKLHLNGLVKAFGASEVIKRVDLDIKDGEFVVFVGPSGCGKSTLLRMIAGLEEITAGEIFIGDARMNDVAPSKRGVAMVFQSYALYPHMSVYNNMAFGLKQAGLPRDEIDRRVRAAASVLHIAEYLQRMPRALSGGQRQRVAIGRAIVREPQVFLFDEPLSNLDAALRVQTRLEIARLHERLRTTMIYVTHDQVEAMTLADKIVVLRAGQIEQTGSPLTLYEKPQNKFVAQFIGSPKMNFFATADIQDSAPQHLRDIMGEDVELGIRPEHLHRCDRQQAIIAAGMERVEHLGEYALVHLTTEGGTELVAKMQQPPQAQKGDLLHFNADRQFCHLFDKTSGTSLSA